MVYITLYNILDHDCLLSSVSRYVVGLFRARLVFRDKTELGAPTGDVSDLQERTCKNADNPNPIAQKVGSIQGCGSGTELGVVDATRSGCKFDPSV